MSRRERSFELRSRQALIDDGDHVAMRSTRSRARARVAPPSSRSRSIACAIGCATRSCKPISASRRDRLHAHGADDDARFAATTRERRARARGWRVYYDDARQMPYYYDSVEKTSRWDRPEDFEEEEEDADPRRRRC